MKFQLNSFYSVQLTERTQNCIYLCYKGSNLKNIHARVIVLMHDTSSQCALQMYEGSLKYQVIEQTRFCDGRRQTDRQTDARGKQYVSRTLQMRDIIVIF